MREDAIRDVRSSVAWVVALLLVGACGNGGSNAGGGGVGPLGDEDPVTIAGVTPARGVFDASLTENGGGPWMSYSIVNVSANDPILPNVSTRIAFSTNGGRSWSDAGNGAAPNIALDVPVFDNTIPTLLRYWTTWQFEVSRLVHDAHDADPNRRWKLLWHRYLQSAETGAAVRQFQHGWIGYSTAPAATGPWSSERKLFVGSLYDAAANDGVIGPPENNLSTIAGLTGCQVFTEPGLLVTPIVPSGSNVYISLKCAGASGKVVLLRCTGDFTPGNCSYRGDLLLDSEAQQFAPTGQSYNGFSATELTAAGGRNFLLVTPTQLPNDQYRGCLVFEILDLDSAALVRSAGRPVLVKRLGGSTTSHHGACGYTPGATSNGIVFGRLETTPPLFRLFDSDVALP